MKNYKLVDFNCEHKPSDILTINYCGTEVELIIESKNICSVILKYEKLCQVIKTLENFKEQMELKL